MIRKGSHADVPFMRSMLAHAYGWRVNALDAEIPLTRYVDNWGRAGDVALVAHETGNRVGAAWFRLFRAASRATGSSTSRRPELTISVVPSRRKHGSGRSCSTRCSRRRAPKGHTQVSLSVEQDSPAVEVLRANGFERRASRTAGSSWCARSRRERQASRRPD